MNNSVCIEKVKCLGVVLSYTGEKCKANKQVQVFGQDDGKVTGYCFACEQYISNPYGEEKLVKNIPLKPKKTPEEIEEEIAEIEGYQTLDLIQQRRLRASTLNKFGAKTSVSERDGVSPTAIYWPCTRDGELVAYHVKPLWEGGFPYFIGDGVDTDLIGWEEAKVSGARRLIITEGPEDMASVDRVFEMYSKPEYHPAVVSLPRGAGSTRKVLQKHAAEIKTFFKDVLLCFDNDEAGEKAIKAAMVVLPNAKQVKLAYKDANEALMAGAAKQLYDQISFRATAPKTTRLVFASALHEASRQPAKQGELTWPINAMNKLTRGIRYGETIYTGAGVKMGKGEWRNELAAHFIKEHDTKIFMASYEETNTKTYKLLLGKLASTFFHDPDIEFDYKAFDEAGEILADRAVFVDLYQNPSWDQTKEDILAASAWGAKAFFIDPITNFTAGVNAGDANTFLSGMARDASSIAKDEELSMFLFCHLKAPEGNISQESRAEKYKKGHYIGLGNCPHEMGGTIYSSQFAGSRAMMQACNMMIGLQGNKDPDLEEDIRNIREVVILEDREFGVTGKFPVFWNKKTSRFSEL